jgi:CHRD domain
MKNKRLISLVLLFLFSISISAQQKFVANLSGLQVVPSSSSPGKAVCFLTLNQTETQLSITCRYENLTANATVAGVGFGAPVGGIGSSIIGTIINNGGQSGTVSLTINLNAQRLADLRANRTYFYINNQNAAEIRGQIHLANSAYNDFDGDGRTDLTVYRNSNNSFYSLSSLNGYFTEKQIGQPGDSVSLTVDFDGDGRSDFSTARYNSEVLWRVFKSSTNTLEETRWGSSTLGDFFAAGDYDGDGAFDIAVFRAGTWYIIESSTGNMRYEYFGKSGDVPAPNDFDKDGKADLTIARSENGQRVWYSKRSSDGQFSAIQWGLSSDAFFTGRTDWDGDGAADISVIRNESGQRVFYILRSSDQQLQVIRWGLSSDVVKLGDYDGDGKTDAAVTRAINGQRVFFVLQSSNGEVRYETFGLQGDF